MFQHEGISGRYHLVAQDVGLLGSVLACEQGGEIVERNVDFGMPLAEEFFAKIEGFLECGLGLQVSFEVNERDREIVERRGDCEVLFAVFSDLQRSPVHDLGDSAGRAMRVSNRRDRAPASGQT